MNQENQNNQKYQNQVIQVLEFPKPEEAKNEIIRRLFEKKDLEKPFPERLKNHAIKIMNIINNEKINRKELCKTTFNGIPDEIRGLRPIIWRILLNYLPLNTSEW